MYLDINMTEQGKMKNVKQIDVLSVGEALIDLISDGQQDSLVEAPPLSPVLAKMRLVLFSGSS